MWCILAIMELPIPPYWSPQPVGFRGLYSTCGWERGMLRGDEDPLTSAIQGLNSSVHETEQALSVLYNFLSRNLVSTKLIKVRYRCTVDLRRGT
jgi:hypothetical protein